MPCMTVVSIGISETAIVESCLLHEEDANAGPRPSVDDRSSDHTAREPSALFLDSDGHNGYRCPCMIVVSVEVSETAIVVQ
jgi:hypothetical protein